MGRRVNSSGYNAVVGNEDLYAPVPSRTSLVVGKLSNSSDTSGNRFVFIERKWHRPHLLGTSRQDSIT